MGRTGIHTGSRGRISPRWKALRYLRQKVVLRKTPDLDLLPDRLADEIYATFTIDWRQFLSCAVRYTWRCG